MKIFIITIAALFVSGTGFLTVKYWGKGQVFNEYKHPFFSQEKTPVIFVKPKYENLKKALQGEKFIYLDVTVTGDQKLVSPLSEWKAEERPIHYSPYSEIKDRVLLISEYKDILREKKIIFNIYNNTSAVHDIFYHNMKELGFEKGTNYLVTSPYEAPIKALKELAPALVYGTTQPEILKIVSMQGMYLLEALSLRADVVIHTLKIKNHNFFNAELLAELKRRHKKIIVGPLAADEIEAANQLEPFALIVNY